MATSSSGMTSFEGYIHKLSEVKTSQSGTSSYFNATLQTNKDTYQDIVCFSPDKRKYLKQFQDQGVAVQLCNLRASPSKRRMDETDFVLTQKSKVLKTSVSFHPISPTNKVTALENITTNNIFSKVHVEGKVWSVSDPENILVNGKNQVLYNIAISDNTKLIKLTSWGHVFNVSVNKSYFFQDVLVKEFNDEKFLSTTKDTSVTEIGDIVDAVPHEPTISEPWLVGNIVGVASIHFAQCVSCKKSILEVDNVKFLTCEFCKTKQLSISLIRKKFFKVTIIDESTNVETFSCFSSVISTLLFETMHVKVESDDDIVCYLLETFNVHMEKLCFQISHKENLISKISLATATEVNSNPSYDEN